MENTYEVIKNNIEKLTIYEKYRKEKHASSRIIFGSEISPVQTYENIMKNTTFIYRNRVPEEGGKVIRNLKGMKGKRIAGIIIQLVGVLLIPVLILFIFQFKSIDISNNTKQAILIALFISIPVIVFAGAIIRCSGRKFMAEYIRAWNSASGDFIGPMEINRLVNGQLTIIYYRRRDKSCGQYASALNPDGTIWYPQGYSLSKHLHISTYVYYIYIIDEVKSCTRTENGLMVESSGRYYGLRGARHSSDGIWLDVWAETQVSYRKEEIPAIFINMDQLESSLMSYGHYEQGRDAFSPL